MSVPEHTATIEKNLLTDEWFIRVRYVSSVSASGKRRYESFALLPTHQGMMFFEACEQIETAVVAHAAKYPGLSRA